MKIRSTGDSVIEVQGTYEPNYAIRTAKPTDLIKVDLPPILGPDSKIDSVVSSTSFGMKPEVGVILNSDETQGCLNPSILSVFS